MLAETPARLCAATARPVPLQRGGGGVVVLTQAGVLRDTRTIKAAALRMHNRHAARRVHPRTSTTVRAAGTPASQHFPVGSEGFNVTARQDTQSREGRTKPQRRHVLGAEFFSLGERGSRPWGQWGPPQTG